MPKRLKTPDRLRIFLCHSSDDKAEVLDLYAKLEDDGFDPWLDKKNLNPGTEWEREIPKALGESDVVIICLSRKSINKIGYVQKEIKSALEFADLQPENLIFIIPLRLEECELPERLSRWHRVDLFEDRGYDRLKKSLNIRVRKMSFETTSMPEEEPQPQEEKHIEGCPERRVILTDIVNHTGITVLNGTLRTALSIALERSSFVRVLEDDKVVKTLKLMGHEIDTSITAELAKDICFRTGVKAYVTGSISKIGRLFALTVEAVNANTGEVIARDLEEAESEEQILKQLGTAASRLRSQLGESLASIQKSHVPLEYTTNSLEALRLYSLAFTIRKKGDVRRVISLLEQAVKADPTFAYAYIGLASNHGNLNHFKRAEYYAEKAHALRDRVSRIEELRILFFFDHFVTGDLEKTIETLEIWMHEFPGDSRVYDNLSDSYQRIGRFDKASQVAHLALERNRQNPIPYINLADSYLHLSEYDRASLVCLDAIEHGTDGYHIRAIDCQISLIKGNTDEVNYAYKWLNENGYEYRSLGIELDYFSQMGMFRKAKKILKVAVDSACQEGSKETASRYYAKHAIRLAFLNLENDENMSQTLFGIGAKTLISKALRTGVNKSTVTLSAVAMALAGFVNEAENLISEVSKQYRQDTLIDKLWHPIALASIEHYKGKFKLAIEILKPTQRYEKAAVFIPQYLRGQCYLKLGQKTHAEIEFDKILNNRGEAPLSLLFCLAQLGKARATLDKSQFEKFFALWENADLDLPALINARREFKENV